MLGFVSDDFGMQGGSEDQLDSCTEEYNLTLEQFAKDHVKGPDAQPVFAWLLAQPNPGPESGLEPTWNFHKYLVSRTGELVRHWASNVYPGDDPDNPDDSFDTNEIVLAIQAELAK